MTKMYRVCCTKTVQDYLHATLDIEADTAQEAIQKMKAKIDDGIDFNEECGDTISTEFEIEDEWEEWAA